MKVTGQLGTALGIAVGLGVSVAAVVGSASDVRTVKMNDQCGPSFNVLGDGTCVNKGGVSFDHFIAELTRKQSVGPWRFNPDPVHLKDGQGVQAENTGGEVHTFTEVEEFGGGIVPILNTLSDNPVVAEACKSLEDEDFIPPGGKSEVEVEEPGVHHYQCCIHPWMRTDVIVR